MGAYEIITAEKLSVAELAKLIDHSLLFAYTTKEEILKFCGEVKEYGFGCAAINPRFIELVAKELKGTDAHIDAPIGYPWGANLIETKAAEIYSCVRLGASGIGRTVANYMAAMGAHIAIFDVSAEKAEAVAAELMELYGGRAMAVVCDVIKPEQVEQSLEQVAETLGVPDVLVNNAGIGLHKFCLDFTPEEWLRVNDVNYNGIFYMATAFARLLIRHGKQGSIINTGSMSAQIVNVPQQQIAYNSSKAGVIHMTHTLAVELADYGIRVNAVSPGYIFTEMTAKRPQELRDDWANRTPQKRLGVPDDLAAAYIYLASDSARYTTGSNIVVDGGYTLI